MQGTTHKLIAFVGLSLAAHGLLLLIINKPEIPIDHPPVGNQTLSISLAVRNKIAPENKYNTKIKSTNGPGEVVDRQQLNQQTYTALNNARSAENELVFSDLKTISNTSPVTSTHIAEESSNKITPTGKMGINHPESTQVSLNETQQEAQRNFLLGEIHHRLSQYINYPDRARRRGWEGSVIIGFNVDKQGYLRDVHLTRTSGYSLLDKAALTAIKKVNYIPVNQWGDLFQPVALQLPVVYRLINS